MNKKAIILLSGGLDSLVALGFPQNDYKIELALTFDYGQKSAEAEIEASAKSLIKHLLSLKTKFRLLIWEQLKAQHQFGYLTETGFF